MSEQQPAVASDASPLTRLEGTVKWFDPRKGFGFVVGPEGQDIFIHFSVIEQTDGFRTLKDGEKIVYAAHYGTKGWAATHVRAVAARTAQSRSDSAEAPPERSPPPRPSSAPRSNGIGRP